MLINLVKRGKTKIYFTEFLFGYFVPAIVTIFRDNLANVM